MTTEEMLEEKQPEQAEKPDTATPEKPKAPANPADELRKNSMGTLKLTFPIRAASEDVNELKYDFCDLTSLEMMEALDKGGTINLIGISNTQALYLFATTVAKCNKKVDFEDVCSRLSGADAIKAVQLAKLFYVASSRRVREKPNT